MGKFVKGQSGNPKGKPVGSQGILTKTVKEAVLETFTILQSDPDANLTAWGRANPHLFYPIAAKLIPAELNIKDHKTITVIAPGNVKEVEE